MECHERGILQEFGVELIGASPTAIAKAEDRTLFREAMKRIGLEVPRGATAHTTEEANEALPSIGLPCSSRPAYTLGGEGGGLCRTQDSLQTSSLAD